MKKIAITSFPIIAAIALAGSAYAISLIAPTNLTYQAPSVNTTLQSYTATDCTSMDTYATVILVDARDSKSYRVRKMPDGRCWMIDNLALATGTTLTSTNTDIDTDAGDDFVSVWSSLDGTPVQSAATHNYGACTSASSVTIANGVGALTCDGSATYSDANDGFVAYSDPSLAENPIYDNCAINDNINLNSLTGCGYFYNWYTATAGSGNYQKGGNVNSSICPAGWSIPKGNAVSAQNEFGVLNNAMATGSTTSSVSVTPGTSVNWFSKGPFEGILAGHYISSFTSSGTNGYYWSSSVNNILNINSSNFSSIGSSGTRNYGLAIRCLL